MDFADLKELFAGNVAWAVGLAGAMLGLTALAGKLLNPARKEEIALWLMGAAEDSWHRTFCDLFDAVFGERHLSWKCLWRSAAASLLAVLLIWLFMGNLGLIGARLQADLSLGSVLVLALGVNLVADYVSLLETRWLLGQMHRVRSVPLQALALLADFLISVAIIWLAIFLFVRSPLYGGEAESFAEILGVFSVFSVLFYSTFLTSVWTWGYILSTWVMRVFVRGRLAHWLDVENNPLTMLGYVLAAMVFLGTVAAAAPLRRDAEGLTAADRALCGVFGGRVCAKVATLTPSQQVQLEFISRACEDGVTQECLDRAFAMWEVTPKDAVHLWRAACEGGAALGCLNLAWFNETGRGVDPDPGEAARLYALVCDGMDARGCTALGKLYRDGLGVASDASQSVRFFRRGCDDGDAAGCTELGYAHDNGIGVKTDFTEAARLYAIACDGGDVTGCNNLGHSYEHGLGLDKDPVRAAELYSGACEDGYAGSCNGLGFLYEQGLGVDLDPEEAARLFALACEGGDPLGCANTGYMLMTGRGVAKDHEEAARKLVIGCDGGAFEGCTNLGVLHEAGLGLALDAEAAARFYRQGCDGGNGRGCTNLGDLYERGVGVVRDLRTARDFYDRGCRGRDEKGCMALERLGPEF